MTNTVRSVEIEVSARSKPYTEEEIRFLIENNGKMLVQDQARILGRGRKAVTNKRTELIRAGLLDRNERLYNRPWTPEEDDYLCDKVGIISVSALCRKLRRTRCAVEQRMKNLAVNQRSNSYTAAMVGELIGVKGSTMASYVRRGLLKGKHGPVRAGRIRTYAIFEEAVESFLRERPWIAKRAQMPQHYFRSIVEEEWRRDPWYGKRAVIAMLRTSDATIERVVALGVCKQSRQGRHGPSWFRRSEIEKLKAWLDSLPGRKAIEQRAT